MPIETLPESETVYYLIAYDADGRERADDPDGLMSERAAELLDAEPITDVFVASHGWMGAIPDAERQYGNWVGAMAAARADVDRMTAARPGFRPLTIGLHWPSKPWGDEEFGGRVSFAPGQGVQGLIDGYAERIADTPDARTALTTIFAAAADNIDQVHPPQEVLDAYATLDEQSQLGGQGPGAAPGEDREPFDAERILRTARRSEVDYGNLAGGVLLAPLRVLSFWKMKDRGRRIGETAGRGLLRQLQQVTGPDVQFHLMGHSFGCIVVSSIVAGGDTEPIARPVHSVALMQGALSLWSYCADIPAMPGRPGYFHGLTDKDRVAGPVVTTRSTFDQAVGRFYPLGAGVAHQVAFAPGELPKYGGVGSFGARGPGLEIQDIEMLSADQPYDFAPGTIYNLEASRYIRHGRGTFGAHSDIAHPEVAHAVWQAALP